MYRMDVEGEVATGAKRSHTGAIKSTSRAEGRSAMIRGAEGNDEKEIGKASLYKQITPREQVKTFNIYRTEFASVDTNLWYFPVQHSISAFFSEQIKNYLSTALASNSYKYAEINLKRMVVKNAIVLSDTITITGSGATEVSSFVQNGKILHYKLGAGSGDAHAYIFEAAGTKLGMLAESLQVGKDETKKEMWLAKLQTASGTAIDTLNTVEMLPLKFDQGLVNSVDEIVSGTKIPWNYGYLRGLSAVNANPAFQTVTKSNLPQVFLKDFVHSYMNAGDEIEVKLPGDLRIFSENFPKLLAKEEIKRGETAVNQLYYAPFGYMSEVFTPGDGSTAFTIHRGSRRHNWQEHDYLTLLPIRNSDGAFMKIRATVEINFEASVNLIWTDSNFTSEGVDSQNVEQNTRLGYCYKEMNLDNSKNINYVMKH